MRTVAPRPDFPTFALPNHTHPLEVFVIPDEWVLWVSLDAFESYLGLPPSPKARTLLRAAPLPGVEVAQLADGTEVVNLVLACGVADTMKRRGQGRVRHARAFLEWVYCVAMPSIMRAASGRPPLRKPLAPPAATPFIRTDGKRDDGLNEAMVYALALDAAAERGPSFLKQFAESGAAAHMDDMAEQAMATKH